MSLVWHGHPSLADCKVCLIAQLAEICCYVTSILNSPWQELIV